MVDITRLKQRTSMQDRVTTNRDGLLPARRETDAPARQVNADMRAARRGDGAAVLRQIFGAVEDAGDSLLERNAEQKKEQKKKDAAQGALDAARGTRDPNLEKRSQAYREALAAGDTERGYNEFRRGLAGEIDQLLNDPNDPASLEEVNDHIEKRFREFALDADGKPKDFGSYTANLFVAESLGKDRNQLLDQSSKLVTKQLQDRGLDNATQNFADALGRGEPVSVESFMAQLVPGTDIAAAKKAFINIASSQAELLIPDDDAEAAKLGLSGLQANTERAKGILDRLILSKRADGTPSFAPDEIAVLREQRARLSSVAEQALNGVQRKLQDEASDRYRDRLLGVGGSYPSMSEIRAARANGAISSEQASTLLGIIETDQREAEADAKAAAREREESASGAGSFGDALLSEVYGGKIDAALAKDAVVRAAARGYFGAGKERKKRMTAVMEEIGKIESGRQSFTETSEFRTQTAPLTHTIGGLRSMIQGSSKYRPDARAATKWLDQIEKKSVTGLGKIYVNSGGDMEGRAAAAGRSIESSFARSFPGLYKSK